MRRALVALAAAAACAAGGPARGDTFERIGDGAPLYVAMRPVALVGALQRVGVDQLPAVQRLKRQMGGIDPFNPAILAAPGIDVAAPLVISLLEPAGLNQAHTRIAASLRDVATFRTFVEAIAASGQLKLAHVDAGSALGKLGVLATGNLAPDTAVIVRVVDSDAIVDVVNTTDGKKAPAAAELARRFAVKPLRPFTVGKGARRLFAPDAAAVVYIDGRRMQPLVKAMAAEQQRGKRPNDKRCAAWGRAPTTFDDVALALGATPEGLSLTWAWGTQSGAPGSSLGGLKLRAVDDAGLDAETLGRDATAVVALYAASLAPFAALKHPGPFANADALSSAIDGCDTLAGMTLVVRSWPLAIAALTATKKGDAGGPFASLQASFGALRNVVVALRDVSPSGPRGAVTATFDPAARTMIELLLAASGGGATTNIGTRSPTVYGLSLPGLPRQVTAALETLAGGRVGFTVADSDDSLSWAFKSGGAPAADAVDKGKPPVLRLSADMAELAKLGPLFNASHDTQQLLDVLAHLRRVDGDLVAEGDLFRLTLHSALKQ